MITASTLEDLLRFNGSIEIRTELEREFDDLLKDKLVWVTPTVSRYPITYYRATPLGQRVIDAALRAANKEMWVAPLGPEATATLDAALKLARENPAGVDLGSFAEHAEDEQ